MALGNFYFWSAEQLCLSLNKWEEQVLSTFDINFGGQ